MDLPVLNFFNVFLNPFTLLAWEIICGSEFHNIMRCCVKKYSSGFLQAYCLIILPSPSSSSCYKIQKLLYSRDFLSLLMILQPVKSLLVPSFPEKSSRLFKTSQVENIPLRSSSLSQHSISLRVLLYLFGEECGEEQVQQHSKCVWVLQFSSCVFNSILLFLVCWWSLNWWF